MYEERLLRYYNTPSNRGVLEKPDFSSGVFNPSCGDQVIMQGTIRDGVVQQVLFEGKGCVISQAAASMVAEYAVGKTVEEVKAMQKEVVLALVQIPLGPNRMRCALLSWEALLNALTSC